MSVPSPSGDRPSDAPEMVPLEAPSEATLTPPDSEPDTGVVSRPSFEEQLAQSPYATSREFTPTTPSVADPGSFIPPPPPSTPVPPPPHLQSASGYETPQFPHAAPMPPPSPYISGASPYSPTGYPASSALPPVYTQQPYAYQPYAQPPSASGNAVAALVCGILAWSGLCFLTGIPAAILGFAEVKRIDRGESSPAGRGMALWGAWLGLINSILTMLLLLVPLIFGFLFAAVGATS